MPVALTDEQLRAAINLADAYESWLSLARQEPDFSDRMQWKTVAGRHYLYRIRDRNGNGTSLGPRSGDTERVHDDYQSSRSELRDRLARIIPTLDEAAAVYRALRLPMIDSYAARLLRELDLRELLGVVVLAVGTTAMAAYALEAACSLDSPAHATRDIDLTWIASEQPDGPVVWQALKALDDTFVVNSERSFQARNRDAREVDLLVGIDRADTVKSEPIRPLASPEQDWLYRGKPLRRIVCGLDARPCGLVVPDPRWFALHKRWLSDKPGRDALKKPKDRRQAEALWQMIRSNMPHYRIDAAFVSELPETLQPIVRQLNEAIA
ncbi:MAG: GSU2403 family nucleotidyltransferase fold protein [Dokdonella sp.]